MERSEEKRKSVAWQPWTNPKFSVALERQFFSANNIDYKGEICESITKPN